MFFNIRTGYKNIEQISSPFLPGSVFKLNVKAYKILRVSHPFVFVG